ncbi:MAG TPA: POTRA domain-containing protein [Acidobacteriaceae bacterium]|jgi:outer membrane protein assembly factor BamA
MRLSRLLASVAIAFSFCTAVAQTYVPKQIRVQGVDASDEPEILRILDIKPNTPISKTEIETALQRLADTGAYSDLSYTVDSNTLTVILKGSPDSELLPVQFSNFVWWKSEELETLLETKVPLYHGKMPAAGPLANQVCAALVALLAEKGIQNAKVVPVSTTIPSGSSGNSISGVKVSITNPPIVLGEVKFLGAAAPVRQQLSVVASKLAGQDFDRTETAAAIRSNTADTHRNGGYLDVTVDMPVFAPPRERTFSYEIDADVDVHPGEIYRISALDLKPAPPVTMEEAETATGLKVGDPAGTMAIQVAQESLLRAYESHGYLEVHIQGVTTRNAATHTVICRFSIAPGALDHLGKIDTSALSVELQQNFAHEWHGSPGMPADVTFNQELFRTLKAIDENHAIRPKMRIDPIHHIIDVALAPTSQP